MPKCGQFSHTWDASMCAYHKPLSVNNRTLCSFSFSYLFACLLHLTLEEYNTSILFFLYWCSVGSPLALFATHNSYDFVTICKHVCTNLVLEYCLCKMVQHKKGMVEIRAVSPTQLQQTGLLQPDPIAYTHSPSNPVFLGPEHSGYLIFVHAYET
jgi:hypothetical protein